MRLLTRRLGLAAGVLISSNSFAQEPPTDTPAAAAPTQEKAQSTPFSELQTLPALNDEQRGKLKSEIASRVETIVNQSNEPTSVTAAAKAAGELRSVFSQPGNSTGFKESFVATFVEIAGPVYKGAKLAPAAQLVSTLGFLNETACAKLLVEALADERPAVRAAAASGLRTLRSKLAGGGGNILNEVIDALRESGKKETSQVGLQAVYAALNYPEIGNPPDSKRIAGALLEILESRAEQYLSRNVKGGGADVSGLAVINANALRGSLTDTERDRLAVVAGRMLFYSVHRYLSDLLLVSDKTHSAALVTERNQTEMLIDECERTLKELLKPAANEEPNLGKAMRDPGRDPKDRPINIRNETAKWGKLLSAKTNQKFELEEVTVKTP